MQLSFRTLGKGQPLVILHGIFGTSDNWQTFGRAASEHYQVFLVDLRNHGNSPHSETFDYTVMAADIQELIAEQQLSRSVLIGHSMGGKVAMQFAVSYPELLDKLVVVDIAPRFYPAHHQQIIAGLEAVNIKEVRSRQEAEEQMAAYVKEPGVRQFLMKSLKRTNEDGFAWKLNLPVIRDNIENVGKALETETSFQKPALFVRGANSNYIQDNDKDDIRKIFPLAQIVTIKDAGHWVHAEQPEALYQAVMHFLK